MHCGYEREFVVFKKYTLKYLGVKDISLQLTLKWFRKKNVPKYVCMNVYTYTSIYQERDKERG